MCQPDRHGLKITNRRSAGRIVAAILAQTIRRDEYWLDPLIEDTRKWFESMDLPCDKLDDYEITVAMTMV